MKQWPRVKLNKLNRNTLKYNYLSGKYPFNVRITSAIVMLVVGLLFSLHLGAAPSNDSTTVKNAAIQPGERINTVFTPMVTALSKVLFWDPFEAAGVYDAQLYDEAGNPLINNNGEPVKAPLKLIVVWLIGGGLFFTIFLRFVPFRLFRHAINLVRGKYDKAGTKGEVSHFQALTTALSATVGLGNIAGVAIAISIGGAGATIWMMLAGFLGMSLKFAECSLGLKYRKIDSKGHVSGGAMYYLRDGLAAKGFPVLGMVLAVLFSLMAVGGSVGGGNMLQANQAFEQLTIFFPSLKDAGFWYGLVMAFFVGLVIVGGIRSIARVTAKVVPLMAIIYVGASLFIILSNWFRLPEAFAQIWEGAFAPDAMKGGFIGVLIFGFQRGAFSNEAGVGSASIAHSAARTNEPVSEGVVALLEPFVDTIIICTMTALVIIFSGVEVGSNIQGVQLTTAAYASVISWFPYILLIAVTLFAFSTMISWSYYGLKGFDFLAGSLSEKLFGSRKVAGQLFNLFFLFCIVVGSSSSLGAVMDFSDMMVLCMAFPNLIGLVLMSGEVKRDLEVYINKLQSGKLYEEE